MEQPKDWILWNIFLAIIPAALAYLLAAGAERFTLREKKLPWIVWLPLALLWFAFVPNSCYLLTEWRHFLLDNHFVLLRDAAENSHVYMLRLARWSLVFLLYTSVGSLTFALSIRPIAGLLRQTRISRILWAVPFFFLTSLGVYLGLVVRLNSWDLYTRPGYVFHTAVQALLNPGLLKVILVFATMLWLLYEIVDIWLDGLVWRIARWKSQPQSD